jgi:hypothetical protein
VKWGWIRNIPPGIPFKEWTRGKTGQTSFRNQSGWFPSGNQLKLRFEILKLDLRTNMRDMYKISPDTSSFAENLKLHFLFKTPFSLREMIKKKIRY